MGHEPEWTHDHCVRYEVARSCINTLIGYRSQWIHCEERKAAPDLSAITRWQEERRAYVAERRNLSIYDTPEKLEQIARESGAEGRRLFEFARNAS